MPNTPPNVIEIFLQPGEFYFGGRDTRIRTLLGSCVSITMWHPRFLIGGMCHFMLPNREAPAINDLDGRYADEAVSLFMQEIRSAGTKPDEYQVKLFGGGNMFPNAKQKMQYCAGKDCHKQVVSNCRFISCRNSRAAKTLMNRHDFNIVAEHLGGNGHRQVMFDVWSGDAWLRHTPISTGVINETGIQL